MLYVHGNPTNSDDWLAVPRAHRRASRPTCPASAARASRRTSTTRSRATATCSRRSSRSAAWTATRWSCTTGGRPPWRWRSGRRSGCEQTRDHELRAAAPGYRWHRLARIWRAPLAGELFMGMSTRWGRKRSPRGHGGAGAGSDEFVDRVWNHFDHGTQRAILKLYRSAPPRRCSQRAGERLGEIRCSRADRLGRGRSIHPERRSRPVRRRAGRGYSCGAPAWRPPLAMDRRSEA